jgi:hypothetical protein
MVVYGQHLVPTNKEIYARVKKPTIVRINRLRWFIEPYVEEMLGDYQCSFRKGRSTTDQIFCLRMILEVACEYKVDIHQ